MKKFVIISVIFHLFILINVLYCATKINTKEKPVFMKIGMVQGMNNAKKTTSSKTGSFIENKSKTMVKKQKTNISKPVKKAIKEPIKTVIVSKNEIIKTQVKKAEETYETKETVNENNDAKEFVDKESKSVLGTGGKGEKGTGKDVFAGGNFSKDSAGTYIAASSDGIDYKIIVQAKAHYPTEARAISYNKEVVTRASFTVGLEGKVESVKVINKTPKLGFREETIKALHKMKFEPIIYKGHNIKCRFTKDFYFYPS